MIPSDHGCSRWDISVSEMLGSLGFGIMLLISIFEHKIVFSYKFLIRV